jgi:hypothetical protein
MIAMQSLLLFSADRRSFTVEALENIFKSVTGFGKIRYNTPVGTPIEADYAEGDDFTMVDLSPEREAISISGTTDAALSAALIIQRHLGVPLRIIDLDYSFDLLVQDFANIEELRAAIDEEQAK